MKSEPKDIGEYFSVKNFEKFQHYKHRSPPWIKLYNDLLDNYEFARLPDASKAHLIAIWLLASRYQNRIPLDLGWLTKRINTTTHLNLPILEEHGFIIIEHGLGNASIMLASCKQNAPTEREREREIESYSRTALPKKKFEEIESALRKAAGLENDPSPSLLDLSSILGLLDKSYSLDEDILPVVRRAGQGKSIKSWTYFTNAIVEAKGKRNGAGSGNGASYQNKRLGERRSSITTAEFSTETWAKHVGHFKSGGMWPTGMGPNPTEKSCKAPIEILTEHGYQQS